MLPRFSVLSNSLRMASQTMVRMRTAFFWKRAQAWDGLLVTKGDFIAFFCHNNQVPGGASAASRSFSALSSVKVNFAPLIRLFLISMLKLYCRTSSAQRRTLLVTSTSLPTNIGVRKRSARSKTLTLAAPRNACQSRLYAPLVF
jgi:hypothetical protein